MSAIRPDLPARLPIASSPDRAAAQAAQAAFFRAAMTGVQPAPAAAPSAPSTQTFAASAPAPAQAPERLSRPGALLDIRV